jgi:hypothetical protein
VSPDTASGEDWAAQLTGRVEHVVEIVRDKTVRPVRTVVRGAIFGTIALALLLVVGTLIAVGVLRLLDDELFHRRVWASYLMLGGIFAVAGALLSTVRHSRR